LNLVLYLWLRLLDGCRAGRKFVLARCQNQTRETRALPRTTLSILLNFGRASLLVISMSLVFKTVQTEGIAELSYIVGDDDEAIAQVFDPRPDVDVYIEMARNAGVAITHIFETHIHADLVSGSRELCARVKSAKIYVSHEGGAEYGFEHEKVNDGDRFEFGEVLVT